MKSMMFAAAAALAASTARASGDAVFDQGSSAPVIQVAPLKPSRTDAAAPATPSASPAPAAPAPSSAGGGSGDSWADQFVAPVRNFVEQNREAILAIDGITKVDWGWPDGDRMVLLTIASGNPQQVLQEFFADFPQARQWDLMWSKPDGTVGAWIGRKVSQPQGGS